MEGKKNPAGVIASHPAFNYEENETGRKHEKEKTAKRNEGSLGFR